LVVTGLDFAIHKEIPMTHVKEAKAVGDSVHIVTKNEQTTILVLGKHTENTRVSRARSFWN